ncbi:MAG: undecaprenyl-diphosphate phosphatase [Candidatus Omnitrophota bacterium]
MESLISGIVQGLTEFLPVSSSGHLVLVHSFFGFAEPNVFFDICLHVATLGAIVLYFSRDIVILVRERNTKWLIYIAVATVPAVLAALVFEKRISVFFVSPRKVSFMLVLTALALFAGQLSLWKRTRPGKGPTFFSSLLVGIAQACALLPGVSRSGMTISTGLSAGMKAEEAFRFSFLLSVPIVIAAAAYKALTLDVGAIMSENLKSYAIGMASAFVTGLLSLYLLWRVLRGKRLFIFGVYCLTLGVIGIFFWR